MTDSDHTAAGLRLVAALTLEHMKPLPIAQQILACDGLAAALSGGCAREARAAADTAEALRRADACQLVFREILNAAA